MSILVDTNLHPNAPPELRLKYPFAPDSKQFDEDNVLTPEMILDMMDHAGVQQACLITSSMYGFDNSYCADSVALYPERYVGIANIDVRERNATRQLEYWIEKRGMHGVRPMQEKNGPATWVDEPKADSIWQCIRDLGVPSTQICDPTAFPHIRRLAERFPEIPVCINYYGHVPLDEGATSDAARTLLGLAQCPRVYVNFPVELVEEAQKSTSAREFLLALFEHFGARRLIWATFHHREGRPPYATIVGNLLSGLSFLSTTDLDWVLGGSTRELYPSLAEHWPTQSASGRQPARAT